MYEKDPIESVEQIIRRMNDRAGSYTQPVLHKYPLLFAFLLTFSAAAIIEGFKIFAEGIEIFHEHPLLLIALGILGLFLTGTLYKLLKSDE